MKSKTPGHAGFARVRVSLADIAGREYVDSVCDAAAALSGRDRRGLAQMARVKIEFFPRAMNDRLERLLPMVGRKIAKPFRRSAPGATTASFAHRTSLANAPLCGYGYYRAGEDGRLRITTKSEHYHVPLGHQFPGYGLLAMARNIGIPNATHNNTRGHLTRLLEQELVRTAGCAGALNRVLNLETGSLAVEAAIKLALARFYRVQDDVPEACNAGKTPAIIVVGDNAGNLRANYHGTTVLAQILRGMWAPFRSAMERASILKVIPVCPNDTADLERAFAESARGKTRPAAFFHEIVMMNYGGIKLSERFLRRAYALCRRHGAPVLVDEIQSCLWNPSLYMFKEYGLRPDMVAVGKGMPGGEYPASRLIFNGKLDCLPQFGALVTNGQEELASLAYLVTMRWAEANAEHTRVTGDHFEARLRELGAAFPALVGAVEGSRHMCSLIFTDLKPAVMFADAMVKKGLDISVQTYKKGCPPAALLKLPLIMGRRTVDFIVETMRQTLQSM